MTERAEVGAATDVPEKDVPEKDRVVHAELIQAASDLRGDDFSLGSWGALDIPLAEWLEATAARVGGKTWTGSRQALRVARMVNGRAR